MKEAVMVEREGEGIEEVGPEIYRVGIPMVRTKLGFTNSYVVRGAGRSLVVDTGLDEKECLVVLEGALARLGVRTEETVFFVTHRHNDHFGLVPRLARGAPEVCIHEYEWKSLARPDRLSSFVSFLRIHGIAEKDPVLEPDIRRTLGTPLDKGLPFRFVKEGDKVSAGAYTFECIETPGHTRGHLSLYEREKKLLFAGDHMLATINPVLEFIRSEGWDPMGAYFASLEKVASLEVDLVLPGHRSEFKNCRGRAGEIRAYHETRLAEMISILGHGSMNAYEAAQRMENGLIGDTRSRDYSLFEKTIATGEAVAHLDHLAKIGTVQKEITEKGLIYSL